MSRRAAVAVHPSPVVVLPGNVYRVPTSIDATGTTDVTLQLQNWLDTVPPAGTGTGANPWTIVEFAAGATYRIEGGLAADKKWTWWRSASAVNRATFIQNTRFMWRARPFGGTSAGSNPNGVNFAGDMAHVWYDHQSGRPGFDGAAVGSPFAGSANTSASANTNGDDSGTNQLVRTHGWWIADWITGHSYAATRKVRDAGGLWLCTATNTSNAGNRPGQPAAPWTRLATWSAIPEATRIEVWTMIRRPGIVPGTDTGGRAFWDFKEAYLIGSVSADGKTATLTNGPFGNGHLRISATGAAAKDNLGVNRVAEDRFWAVSPRRQWERYDVVNGLFPKPPPYLDETANGTAVERALSGGSGNHPTLNTNRVINIATHHFRASDLRARSSNTSWKVYYDNSGPSDPLYGEEHVGIVSQPASHHFELDNVDVFEIWSSGLSFDGGFFQVKNSKIYRSGRQPVDISVAFAFKFIDCVFYGSGGGAGSGRALVDFEPNSVNARPYGTDGQTMTIDWFVIRGCTWGRGPGNSGAGHFANASPFPVGHGLFEDNHSLNADVPTVPTLASIWLAGGWFGPQVVHNLPARTGAFKFPGGPAGYFIWRDNRSNVAAGEFRARNHTHLLIEDNDREDDGGDGWLFANGAMTDFKSRGNKTDGVLDPQQYDPPTTASPGFVEPGTPSHPDWWWAAGAPDPPDPFVGV